MRMRGSPGSTPKTQRRRLYVIAVYTGKDAEEAGLGTVYSPAADMLKNKDGTPIFKHHTQPDRKGQGAPCRRSGGCSRRGDSLGTGARRGGPRDGRL